MGRTRLWDAQLNFKWLQSWLDRLKAVAEASGEDAGSIVRQAAQREIERREKKLGIVPDESEV